MMSNPPSFLPPSGSYEEARRRIAERLRKLLLAEQIRQLLEQNFERELAKEAVVLSRSDRQRLYRELTEAILADVRGVGRNDS